MLAKIMPDDGAHYFKRERDQRSMANADQAEALAIKAGAALVDEGVYDDQVAGAMDDFEDEGADREEWHARDLADDVGAGAIQEFIEQRAKILGDLYPFEILDNRIVHRGRPLGWYEFMLAASLQRDISSAPFNRLPQLFERAGAKLARGLLGPGAESLHVGAPRDATATFREVYDELFRLTGEWKWKPDEQLPVTGPRTGDEGLDFVVWRDGGDGRRGALFLVGQCACGDNWSSKLTELNLDRIGKWMGKAWAVPPTRLFLTTHVVALGYVTHAQGEAGFILDRLRLTLLEHSHGPASIDEFRAEMTDLTRRVFGL